MTQPEGSERGQQPMRSLVQVLGVIAIIAVLLAAYVVLIRPGRILLGPGGQRGIGEQLADLSLSPLTGDASPVSLDSLKNKVTLLNFWGTWCPPCRRELPHIAAFQKRFASEKAFQLLAVSCPGGGVADDPEALRKDTGELLAELDISLPTYRDAHSITLSAVDAAIGFSGYPTTLLLDRKGVIRAIWVGYAPGAETEMERKIAEILGEEKLRPEA